MCHSTCFEAGRFTQIQSSRTAANCCSRTWMSGPADALAPSKTNRKRSIGALLIGSIVALQMVSESAGGSVFSLDKSLSWMPHLLLHVGRPDFQYGEEGFLRDLHAAHALHALFAFLLLLHELALAADVATVSLGDHVFAQGRNGFAGHYL